VGAISAVAGGCSGGSRGRIGYGGGGGEVAAGCTEDMAGGQHCVEKSRCRMRMRTTFEEK